MSFKPPNLCIDLGTCDALLCVSHTSQSKLERKQEARSVQIDLNAAFDRVTIREFSLIKLCSVGVGGSQFFSIVGHSICSGGLLSEHTAVNLAVECLREVFWARSCSSCTLQSFPHWRTSFEVMLTAPIFIVLSSPGKRAAAGETVNRDLTTVIVCGVTSEELY